MDGNMTTEKQGLISSFLDIAVGQSTETAAQFLQATSWKLEEAIQLFYVGNEGGGMAPPLAFPPPTEPSAPPIESSSVENIAFSGGSASQELGDGVRAPLPVRRETLYGDASFYGREFPVENIQLGAFRGLEEARNPSVWVSNQSDETSINGSRDNLASLYRPPFALMFKGPFDEAKIEASNQDKWLLINLQSTEEFNSHKLNRDTWSNEAVAQTIRSNFIFWQIYHDSSEGMKVCTYYKVLSFPSILVIDPITGQKMHSWSGMVNPERFLEGLLPFMDRGPKEQPIPNKRPRQSPPASTISIPDEPHDAEDAELSQAIAASLEDHKGHLNQPDEKADSTKEAEVSTTQKLVYPPLPEEPKGSRELLSRVGVRLPDGRRLQRTFLRTDPIKLLWSFCYTNLDEGEVRPFHFMSTVPGMSKTLEFDSDQTFDESGISNSMVLLTWI